MAAPPPPPSTSSSSNDAPPPSPTAPSPMRRTATSVIAAFNAMDIDSILFHRTPDCTREFLPRSMGYPPQDNATYGRSLRELKHVFRNFSLVVEDIVEDVGERKMCLWLRAGAETVAGGYENDYVWMWEFEGEKVKRSREYSDSMMSKEFYPKLKEAMMVRRGQGNGGRVEERDVEGVESANEGEAREESTLVVNIDKV